jgi:hypothetical protein
MLRAALAAALLAALPRPAYANPTEWQAKLLVCVSIDGKPECRQGVSRLTYPTLEQCQAEMTKGTEELLASLRRKGVQILTVGTACTIAAQSPEA